MATVVWDSCGSDFVSLNLQITISVNWPLPCKLTTPQSCHHLVFQWLHSYFLGFFKHHLEKICAREPSDSIVSFWNLYIYRNIKLQFRSKLKSDLSDTPTPIVFNTFTYKTLWSEIYSTISSNHVCSIQNCLTTMYWNVYELKLFMYLYLSFIFIIWRHWEGTIGEFNRCTKNVLCYKM